MPAEVRICCRWTLTFLHVVMCLVSGACILSVLLLREKHGRCLPPLIGDHGNTGIHFCVNTMYFCMWECIQKANKFVKYDDILDTFCDVMLYSAGVISGWSILSLFVQCCWQSKLCFALQTVIFAMVSILCLVGSATLTTQFLLWCKDLQAQDHNSSSPTCLESASHYDDIEHQNISMSVYYTTDIIQQGCTWILAVLATLMTFVYISLVCAAPVSSNHTVTRVIYVRDGEQQPLIPREERDE